MKVPLQRDRKFVGLLRWTESQPFVENSRAILIHRPRTVSVYRTPCTATKTHLGIGMWCGNHMSGDGKFTFLDAPPEGKLVCARCEAMAIASNQPTSDSLVGKHVHIGGLRAFMTCCEEAR